MAQYGFFFNGRRCMGCKTCEMACKDAHDLPVGRTYRRVYEYTGGGWETDADGCSVASLFGYYVSVSCNHCDSPVCVASCAAGAIAKDAATGLVSVDTEACVGCGSCVEACPYGAVVINDETSCAEKCDGCADRVAAGGAPVCVESCPMRALAFGPVDEVPEGFERAAIAPLPTPDATAPNLYVRAPRAAEYAGEASNVGAVTNPNEI